MNADATAAHAEAAAGTDLIVPLHSRRRKRGALAQKLQHVIAGAGLFFSGVQSLSAHAEGLENAEQVCDALREGQRRLPERTA